MNPVAQNMALNMAQNALASGAGLSKKMSQRNMMVKELMAKHHMTLPQASKYIKENNLM